MALTPVDIIVTIFVLLALIKLIIVLINKELWYRNVVKPIYSNIKITGFIFVILAILLFYFLLQELSITQIFAVIAFSSFFIVLSFLQHQNEFMQLVEKAYKKEFNIWSYLYIIVWLILLIWVLYEVFLKL